MEYRYSTPLDRGILRAFEKGRVGKMEGCRQRVPAPFF